MPFFGKKKPSIFHTNKENGFLPKLLMQLNKSYPPILLFTTPHPPTHYPIPLQTPPSLPRKT